MKKCPVCGVMMGDNVARCSMCKYDFQKASGGDASAVMAEAKRNFDKKEEENLARTEARRSEEEKRLAEIREKINREMETLTTQFEAEKVRIDKQYELMQKAAEDEKARLEAELEESRSLVQVERDKISAARSQGEQAKQEKIAEGQAEYDKIMAQAANDRQVMLDQTQKEINEAASRIDAEYAEVIKKRDQAIAEAQEAQAYIENADQIRKELEAVQAEQDNVIAAKKQEIAAKQAEYDKLAVDFEAEKARLEKEGRAIAEQQAGEALKIKEQAEKELAQITAERDAIIVQVQQQQEAAQQEIDGIREQAKQIIEEAETAAAQRDEAIKIINEAESAMKAIQDEKSALEADIAKETADMEAVRSQHEQTVADLQNSAKEWSDQISAISAEYEAAKVTIADAAGIEVAAKAQAEEIILEAEKRSVFLKEAALKESDKGTYLKTIEEKENIIKEMEMEKSQLDAKIAQLEASMQALEKKAAAGGFGGGADNGPKEYAVEVVNHNGSSEVDAEGLAAVLATRSADGWKLVSVINDDGGKLQSSLGGNDGGGSGSLAMGSYVSKEDRVVLIFERSKK